MFVAERDRTCVAPLPLQTITPQTKRWGIVLAGGDGVRLRKLTRFISGDDRPKQFCRVLGPQTLLEQARSRAARSIPEDQTILALTTAHQTYYGPDLMDSPSRRLLQPMNRGTAPAIILSLFHIIEQDPDAVVAILPCDHFYSNEFAFTGSLESAFRAATNHPDSVVLLVARPSGPDRELGWVQPGPAHNKNLFRVSRFEEKPSADVAERLFRTGAMWNTFVMVGRAVTFLWMSLSSVPELFAELGNAAVSCDEDVNLRAPSALFSRIKTVDFSRQILAPNSFRLLAMPFHGLEWQDLGHADRVLAAVQSHRSEPPNWVHAWQARPRFARGSA